MSKKKGKNKGMRENKVGSKKMRFGNAIAALIVILAACILYYLWLPAINVQSVGFWIWLLMLAVMLFFAIMPWKEQQVTKPAKVSILVIICIATAFFICVISSLKIFSSRTYAGLLTVEDGDFETDITEAESINDIAIMDTETAVIIGARSIGSLTDIVSQYNVSEDYSQIDYQGKPMKIAPLCYAGFIKYMNNRKNGIPGYVMVDPVENTATYIALETPMKYTPYDCFSHNLQRYLRKQYPTYIYGGYHFELDNDGNPFYVCPVMNANAGVFGAMDVKGAVICDPCTGESKYYEVAEIPVWVDRVYDGDSLAEKYDWYGMLSGGYWNSIFGNKGCKRTTDDYGYKVIDGDVWIYTGVTSVNADESNIGFVLMNERTSEAKYYQISGAEEYSAMSSAQGELQHLGYVASFPSLINIGGEPTYIMAMKDEAGLVKMYALVNVQKYNIVATGTTQREALTSYKKLLKENNISVSGEAGDTDKSKTINIASIRFVNVDDETIVYIIDTQDQVYKQNFAENESLIFLQEHDRVTVYYEEGENGIHSLISYE